MTTPQATKIVIVSGQEFSVPAETDNEAIRTQLSGMGFADVASATITKGTRDVDGQKVETIEFVKKAGTKGMYGADLVALLDHVPAAKITRQGSINRSSRALLDRLNNQQLTFGDALADGGHAIDEALIACSEYQSSSNEGAVLCDPCDHLPAVAAAAPCGW